MDLATGDKGYISKLEVACRLNRTPRTVELWVRKWGLPRIKVGRSVLFNWPAIEAYLNSTYGK